MPPSDVAVSRLVKPGRRQTRWHEMDGRETPERYDAVTAGDGSESNMQRHDKSWQRGQR